MKLILGLIVVFLSGATCEAGLFLGAAAFSSGPTSQLGSVTNNLVVTNTANGFTVSGQVIITINVAPPTNAGTLVQWTVDRPLDPAYTGPFTLSTTTVLNGFSAPPVGVFQPTSGQVSSEFTNVGAASQSQIPMTLVNGLDSPPWNNLTSTSSTFLYAPSAGNLRQSFVLDGVYLAGPGGTWTIDVPVTTFATSVPEPSGLVLGILAASSGFVFWRRAPRVPASLPRD